MGTGGWRPDLYLNGTTRILDNQAWLELPGRFSASSSMMRRLTADRHGRCVSSGIRTADDSCGAILDWILCRSHQSALH